MPVANWDDCNLAVPRHRLSEVVADACSLGQLLYFGNDRFPDERRPERDAVAEVCFYCRLRPETVKAHTDAHHVEMRFRKDHRAAARCGVYDGFQPGFGEGVDPKTKDVYLVVRILRKRRVLRCSEVR